MARNTAALILLLLAGGCASRAPERPYVALEPDGALWRATWHLDAPARELRFDRPAAAFRAGHFEVLTPGYAFVREGEHEVLRAAGEPSRTIAVRFAPFTRHLPKDYEFFVKFTDGSAGIYTGHLLVHHGGDLVRDFRFVPPAGARVVAGGRRSSTPMRWRDGAGQGTYVYFGSIEPVESADAISIVDPGLPDWLETRTREMLPRLFALYAERLGVKLRERPVVLFHYVRSEQSGFSSSGGTLPGLVQLGIEGTGWTTESQEGQLQLFHFLAHEAAHLWNGQIIHYPGSEDAWMHEGSADGLAERALLDLGLIDEARFLESQSAALNECRRGLGSEPLRTAGARGKFELYYSCGNALALMSEAAAKRDLFAIWRALIQRALPTGTYQLEDYLAAWRSVGASDADADALRALVERPASPDALVDALTSRGIAVADADPPPQKYGQALARDALLHLLSQRCTGSYGFNATNRGLVLRTPVTCEGFAGGEAVTAIGDHDVLREGHRAWDHLHERCGTARPALVTTGGREVEVACTKPVPARPAYVRVVKR